MKLLSWNVNGLRACVGKGFLDFVNDEAPDCLCIQETKMQQGQLELDMPGYHQYFNDAVRKGYSGTAIFTRQEPLHVQYGLPDDEHNQEGRVITLEYPDYYLLTVYTPNAQRELVRIDYRMAWEDAFRAYMVSLDQQKPVIACGDFNVAHNEIDLKNPASNRGNAGFSDQERGKFTELLAAGFADTFRARYPDARDAYTWWSYMFKARERNTGWRIDYFLVSQRLLPQVQEAFILPQVMGSDHCPVGILL